MQTAQQYLLNQAEHCRRTASDCGDPEIADELRRLAKCFEEEARLQPRLGLQTVLQMG